MLPTAHPCAAAGRRGRNGPPLPPTVGASSAAELGPVHVTLITGRSHSHSRGFQWLQRTDHRVSGIADQAEACAVRSSTRSQQQALAVRNHLLCISAARTPAAQKRAPPLNSMPLIRRSSISVLGIDIQPICGILELGAWV